MSIGAFSNAILRNGVMAASSLAVTADVVLYLGKKYNLEPKKVDGKDTFKMELAACGAGSLFFANLAYGLGGSLGNHYFNTANKWTVLKTLGQISTQVLFGTLLCGVAALVAKKFIGPELEKLAREESKAIFAGMRGNARMHEYGNYVDMSEVDSYVVSRMGEGSRRPIKKESDSFPVALDFSQPSDGFTSSSDEE